MAALLRAAPAVEAQYKADTPQFEEKMETAEAELIESLEGGDYVEDVFHPERQVRQERRIFARYNSLCSPRCCHCSSCTLCGYWTHWSKYQLRLIKEE